MRLVRLWRGQIGGLIRRSGLLQLRSPEQRLRRLPSRRECGARRTHPAGLKARRRAPARRLYTESGVLDKSYVFSIRESGTYCFVEQLLPAGLPDASEDHVARQARLNDQGLALSLNHVEICVAAGN